MIGFTKEFAITRVHFQQRMSFMSSNPRNGKKEAKTTIRKETNMEIMIKPPIKRNRLSVEVMPVSLNLAVSFRICNRVFLALRSTLR